MPKDSTSPARASAGRSASLTTPDLVLLSLLTERPMHGYQANAELERREIRDWADVSRPQVYYSLEKLARLGLIRPVRSAGPSEGPERSVFATTRAGRAALATALERPAWTAARDRPPFLTWLALSWLVRPGVIERQFARRREFLRRELAREQATLASVLAEVGHPHHEAVWMISLMLDQFEAELRWLEKVKRQLSRRRKARRPSYAAG